MHTVIPDPGGILARVPAYGRRLDPKVSEFLEEVVQSVPLDFGGGSGASKALVLADLIVSLRLRTFVEIGVYKGRSLLPIATMFRVLGEGTAIGIDPWSAQHALQHDDHAFDADSANAWVEQQPWDETYQGVADRIELYGLSDHCQLIRMTSEEAAPQFADGSVDMVHIDGNHDRAAVERDVELYLPKLKAGGVLVLDDATWDAVRPIGEALRSRVEPIFQLFDSIGIHEDQGSDFQVFRVPQAA
jgi:hypothetical protein